MSSPEKVQVLIIKGAISELASEEQTKVHECASCIKQVVSKYGDLGPIALALVGAEAAAKD